MRLEISNFPVNDLCFGDKTEYRNGHLTINKAEALKAVMDTGHIVEAELYLVKPGDSVRITPVKDVCEVRCKVTGSKSLFPGFYDKFDVVGEGEVNAMKNFSVLVSGKKWGAYPDGLVDMAGPGQDETIFGHMNNIVLVAETDEVEEREKTQKKNLAYRKAGMALASYLGECLRELKSDDKEIYDLPYIGQRSEKLPNVVYIIRCPSACEVKGYNLEFYGHDMAYTLPQLCHPNEILDGALIGGSFSPAGSRATTYGFQNDVIIKDLMAQHGKTLNFMGVIVSGEKQSSLDKRRVAVLEARLAKCLGADGALVCKTSYGQPEIGFMISIQTLEKYGIKTVGLTEEFVGRDGKTPPMTIILPEAVALVSGGNLSKVLTLPPLDVVLGDVHTLERDGNAGGRPGCVAEDGTITIESQSFLFGDGKMGMSVKRGAEF